MAKPWRWIDRDDGTHTLVEGEEFQPLSRVVLECGDVEAGDQDRIARVPRMESLLGRFLQLAGDRHTSAADWSLLSRDIDALARGRGA